LSADDLNTLLWCSVALLAVTAAAQMLWQLGNRIRLGDVRLRRAPRRRLRLALSCAAALVALWVISAEPLGRSPVVLAVLGLAVWLIASSPGFQDSIYGAAGVQRGWYARRFRELGAWRLVGEHLRWKLFGTWVATDVPMADHAALRTLLEAEAPGRESSHGNAGFDPQRAALAKSKS
jgi:hypothetical protein